MSLLPKTLIIDANILFSFFNKDSIRRNLIKCLINRGTRIVSPDFVLEELIKDKEKIIKFAKINSSEFDFLFSLIKRNIQIVPKKYYKDYLSQVRNLSPHNTDTKDDAYFALSLYLDNCPIWSDEKGFREQTSVKILTTKDLLDIFTSKSS